MNLLPRRLRPHGRLTGWQVALAVVSGAVVAIGVVFSIATFIRSTNSIWNQPQTPIGDVLDRVDGAR